MDTPDDPTVATLRSNLAILTTLRATARQAGDAAWSARLARGIAWLEDAIAAHEGRLAPQRSTPVPAD